MGFLQKPISKKATYSKATYYSIKTPQRQGVMISF